MNHRLWALQTSGWKQG